IPISIGLFLLFLLMVPLLMLLVPAVAFSKLGLNPWCGYMYFLACLFTSGINIPVYRRQLITDIEYDEISALFYRFFGIRPPYVAEETVAVNLGGAVLPCLLSLYLLFSVPQDLAIAGTLMVSLGAYILSRPVRGIGIVMPAFVPPLLSAIVGLMLSRQYAPQIAFVSGTLGTLIGADLLRLRQFRNLGAPFLSIGGAGVFDGIYLVGLVSVLLA
ncbi:MAG: DUF1614 domain-containing protein, partial [Nitrospirae bacterium]